MCIVRKAKRRRERRCFKVPEFDSSERLLVTSARGGTFVLHETETGKDAGGAALEREETETDPWKMADRKREERGRIRD